MKTLASLTQAGALAVAFSLALTACQKTRHASFPYGADRDVMNISDYENKDYDLNTKGPIKSSDASALSVKDERKPTDQVRNFDYVDYDAKDPLNLTDKTLMLGRPNWHYKVRYVFDGNFLKVMKISKVEDLATDELASSEDAGNGLKMVPIVSYSASYFSTDTTRNELHEKTSKLELVPRPGRSGSTQFKIDLNSKTRATFLSKRTVLPANFFDGDTDKDWYFSFTVISQNYREDRGSLGQMMSFDKYGREAFKVRARKVEDKIVFYNVGIDDRMEKSIENRQENQTPVLSIPVEFVDYRMGESGKTSTVKEESYKERAWNQRSYADMKLKDIVVPGGDLGISEIKDVQLDNGYFSFLVQSEAFGGIIRVSLMSHKSYEDKLVADGAQPYKNLKKIYFREDQNLFGYFSTHEESLRSFDRQNEDQAEKLTYINRFNPTRKEIEFRLNNDAPAWMDELLLKAGAAWNATFHAAGSNIHIRVSDNQGKALRGSAGDLRYSLVNMFGDVDGGGPWGGVGPVLADPQTGEIIMATANINITDRVEAMYRTLSNYILSVRGDLAPEYILGVPMPSLQSVTTVATNTLQKVIGAANASLQAASTYIPVLKNKSINFYNPSERKFSLVLPTQETKTAPLKLSISNQALMEGSFIQVNGNIVDQVKAVCPDLEAYAQGLKNSNSNRDEEKEIKLIKACSVELAKPSIISVILHEMGHNFGLRHNFYGSSDYRNFFAPVDLKLGSRTVKTQWRSSSVMDYMTMNYENMTQPGLYDIAAIRWGYTDQIENAQNQLVKVSPAKSTRSQVQSNYHLYKYCTDENVDTGATDPMCAREDEGVSPLEVVKNLILEYDSTMATWNHRHNHEAMWSPLIASYYRFDSYIRPMRKFYEQWRLILSAAAGPGNEYLESIDTQEQYNALLQKVLDPKIVGEAKSKENEQYHQAANLIFSFLMRISFLPDYSCVTARTINDQPVVQLFPFSKVQKALAASGKAPTSCQDSDVQNYLKTQKGASVFAEAGYPFDSISKDINNITFKNYSPEERPETLGVAQDRWMALWALVDTSPEMYHTWHTVKYAPNFMNEYPFRVALTNKVVQRLTQGVSIEDIDLDKVTKQQLSKDVRIVSPMFETEKPLLSLMFDVLRIGQVVPDHTVITNNRLEKYTVMPMWTIEPGGHTECASFFGIEYCATDKNIVAQSLVKKLNSLQSMKAATSIQDSSIQKFIEITKDLIPAAGQPDNMDISFLKVLSKRIDDIKKTDPDLYKQLSDLSDIAFGPEANLWLNAESKQLEKIKSDDLSDKERTEKIDALKKLKLKDLAARLGVENYVSFNADVLKSRLDTLRAEAQEYSADVTELDAQSDLIMEALLGGRPF
jgi:hypothetical protein